MSWGSSRWGRSRWSENAGFYLALSLATMPGPRTVRVFFNHLVDNDAELNRLSNWSVVPAAFGGVTVGVTAVEHAGGVQVDHVDLTLDRAPTAAEYRAVVVPDKISDFGYYCREPFNRVTFLAASTAPVVVKATPLSARRLEVLFSEEMDETVEITDPGRYILTPSIRVAKVVRTGLYKVAVDLAADMVPDRRYQIVVTP